MKSIVSPIQLENGRRMAMECIRGVSGVINVPIYEKDGEAPVGRVLLIENEDPGPLVLLDVVVYDEKNRRKGIADDLMELICGVFPHIVTGYFGRAGRELCLKHGFKLEKSIFKNKPDFLIYKKEDGHAVDEKGGADHAVNEENVRESSEKSVLREQERGEDQGSRPE